MKELTHISLFAGIGGIDLAAEWAGFRTILFVEIDPFCQKVLRKHWPGVPIIGDIRDVKGKEYSATLITGGFPCQPVSQAGQRRGKADDRWLWSDMLRVISEVRSAWVVAENVTGLLTMGFYDCLSDLEGEGYETIPFVIPACGVNAPHRRDRIFIVANSKCQRWRGGHNGDETRSIRALQTERPSAGNKQEDVADTNDARCPNRSREHRGEQTQEREGIGGIGGCGSVPDTEEQGLSVRIPYTGSSEEGVTGPQQGDWWAVEPELGRVAYGIRNRVDRLKCLGNAVVPQQIYPILKAIADIENDGSIL